MPTRRKGQRDAPLKDGEPVTVRVQEQSARSLTNKYYKIHIPSKVAQALNLSMFSKAKATLHGKMLVLEFDT